MLENLTYHRYPVRSQLRISNTASAISYHSQSTPTGHPDFA
jgi:hypothetical protein